MTTPESSRTALDDLFRLIDSGQVQHAESRCRAYLKDRPDDINLLALLGAIYVKLGRIDDAQPILEKTIQLEPEFAKPHEDLGALHLRREDAEEALHYFDEALRLDPNLATAWSGRAAALMQLGREDEAAEARQKFVELSPVAQGLQKASQLLSEGNAEKAQQLCDGLNREYPNNKDILRMLARIATESGNLIVAEGLLKRVVKMDPEEHRGHVDLGMFLGQIGRYPEAVEALRTAVTLNSEIQPVSQRLGDYLAILGKPAEALEVYDSILEKEPGFVPALVGKGHMLRILGRHDEAARAYEGAVAVQPDYGDAWWGLASLRTYRLGDEQVSEIARYVSDDAENDESQVFLRFALARAAEDAEDYAAAWKHYVDGNALKRFQVDYDPVRTEISHNSMIEVFDAEFAGQDIDGDAVEPTPIFIVGMPRSGSTLLEQILASHSAIEGTSELPYIGMLSEALAGPRSGGKQYPELLRDMNPKQFSGFGKSYLHYTRNARLEGLPFFTDKMPANFVHVGLIHLSLPGAKIIDARRHPLDTCIGNFRQLFAKGKNHSYDLFECAEYYLEYLRIMQHWDDVLPGRVLRVQYENVVNDLEGEARRMLDYCGLPWEDAVLDFHNTDRAVNTASSEQVRAPIYKDAMGFWKNYDSEIGELKELLAGALAD